MWPWTTKKDVVNQLKWEKDAVLHWQNQAHFWNAYALQKTIEAQGAQRGIRRLVQRVKRLKRLKCDQSRTAREILVMLQNHWAEGGDNEGTFENIMDQVNRWLDANPKEKER
jgi:hypothetical protein